MSMESINNSVSFLRDQINGTPEIGLILGSGLGVLADEIQNPQLFPYEQIPDFPVSTVEGHKGQLVFGELNGKQVVAMQGRFHYYEGYSINKVTFPVRVMKELGVKTIVVTNAAGGVNESFNAGDLMIISDHINFMNDNPLIGPNDIEQGVRFPDMSNAYSKELALKAKATAEKLNIPVKEGVYFGNSGPSYETPAEVRMIRKLGGDAVGMSTVPEVIVARHSGLNVLGISCISNMAAGILDQPLTHDEVMETTELVKENFIKLIKTIIQDI